MKIRIKTMILVCFILAVLIKPVAAGDADALKLTLEEAVKLGLENSIQLEQVKNEIDLKHLALDRAEYLSDKLEDADERISEGKRQLSEAQTAINNDIAPQDIPLTDEQGNVVYIVEKGTNLNDLVNAGIITEEGKSQIKQQMQEELDKQREQLESGELTLINSVQEAGDTLSTKLDFSSLDALSLNSTTDLMTTMAEVSYEVAKASYDIYRNKIALLIQKSYYDVLKAKKLLEVKEKAVQRAEKQYHITKAAFEEGMKARDELLLAQLYYEKTQIEYEKARGELNTALIELKKNLNIPMDTGIELSHVLADEVEELDLEEGLAEGMKNRLEVKKALGEVIVYDLNFELTRKKYPSNTFQYKEAKLLKEKARLNFEQTKREVEASIRKSYETMQSAARMLEKSRDMINQAKEIVEIAQYKYNEGFGVENSLLRQLNLESTAGTIVEVLAAQENLTEVEEKVVEIMYGYNLARMKYLNDIGRFVY